MSNNDYNFVTVEKSKQQIALLLRLLQANGASMRTLADIANVSHQTIYAISNYKSADDLNSKYFTLDIGIKIMEALGYNINVHIVNESNKKLLKKINKIKAKGK